MEIKHALTLPERSGWVKTWINESTEEQGIASCIWNRRGVVLSLNRGEKEDSTQGIVYRVEPLGLCANKN